MDKVIKINDLPSIDSEEKKIIARSFKNIKFKYYSAFDMRILVAMLALAAFIIASPFIIITLNKGSISDYFHRMANPLINYDVLVISGFAAIFLSIAIVQLIRMNFINKCAYIETKNNKQLLIINGWLRKKYIINGKAYVIKKENALSIRRKEKSRFETLLSYTQKANLYKIQKDNTIIYDTKLININSSKFDWLIETGLSSLPGKYVRLKYKEGNLVKGILSGSQHQCATYFSFKKLDKQLDKSKLPDCIKNNIEK